MPNKKIALIVPKKTINSQGEISNVFDWEPLGVFYLSAVLNSQGHSPKVFHQFSFQDDYSLLEKVVQFQPDYLGFSTITSNFNQGIRLAKKLKQKQNIPIIFGGSHASLIPEIVMEDQIIDYLVIGEGEITLVELLQALENHQNLDSVEGIAYRKGGTVKLTNKRERLKFTRYH